VADVQIANLQKVGVPSSYVLPGSAEVILKCVNADFDGSGSGGDYLPCVTILDNSGQTVVRAVDQNARVIGGSDAEVSWFRGVRKGAAATTQPKCQLLGSAIADGVTIVLTLTKAVPASGTLQVVLNSVGIGHQSGNLGPDNVVDSNAVAGWIWNTATDPLIGLVTEQVTGSGPAAISLAGSVARPCTAGDLGVGSTITVHWDSLFPGENHLAGLVVYQPAYFTTRKQFGSVQFGNSDDHPGNTAPLARLSWDDDYGPGTVTADRDAAMITAMGAYPAVAGFKPFVGSVIGEIASGSCSIAAVCAPVCEGALPDPGGTWPSDAIQLVGNYQMVEPRTCSAP
jgi:hypothetical protein